MWIGAVYVTKDNNVQQCDSLHFMFPPYRPVQFKIFFIQTSVFNFCCLVNFESLIKGLNFPVLFLLICLLFNMCCDQTVKIEKMPILRAEYWRSASEVRLVTALFCTWLFYIMSVASNKDTSLLSLHSECIITSHVYFVFQYYVCLVLAFFKVGSISVIRFLEIHFHF
jgi:hypothetical protein